MDYDRMVDSALRQVVRDALIEAGEVGLRGNHHFYISFNTSYPGVEIPDYLRQQYAEEMTIVVQHQFWGLEVTDDWFTVTLSFNKVQERLEIPFAAVSAFADPSVEFGLQFRVDTSAIAPRTGNAVEAPVKIEPAQDDTPQPAVAGAAPAADKTGEVITLDSFRKKK